MLRASLLLVAVAILAGAASCVSSSSASAPASFPRCFGAAARDPLHPCHNHRLDRAVVPTPSQALLTPNAPCDPIEPVLNVCSFGVQGPRARATVALIGNSHAAHWRAALAVAAVALDWRGVSITRSSCPFMRATIDLAEPLRAQCLRWNAGIPDWLAAHPEVGTVFVSDQPTPPIVPRGHSELAVQVGAYIAAWRALPRSVGHIVVIRDNPYTRGDVLACVEAAMARHEAAGPRCAVPRRLALKPDPAAIAARLLRSPRVRVIDMTNYFCGPRECEPVIGGALVYRDATHLTRTYATTLGPYLLRQIRALLTPRAGRRHQGAGRQGHRAPKHTHRAPARPKRGRVRRRAPRRVRRGAPRHRTPRHTQRHRRSPKHRRSGERHRSSRHSRPKSTVPKPSTPEPVAPGPTSQGPYPPCFGAPARDPQRPCRNPALASTVLPAPSEALLAPNSPCEPLEFDVCTFGFPVERAQGTVALIGDSHAWQWRAAVEVVADGLGWHAFDVTRFSCPFTAAETLLPGTQRAECTAWNRSVPAWFEQHPEASVAIVSAHPGSVVRARGQSMTEAQIAGYIAAWRSLPPTVRHIVVLRNTPDMRPATFACIEAAMRLHKNAGAVCALSRRAALRPDPEALAVARLHSARVQLIDLTPLLCDARRCYPVVGGALAFRDPDHLTPVFAATAGPYLLRELNIAMAHWR